MSRKENDLDSYSEYPTYIKHWEQATPTGWRIKILTETGLHTIDCKWRTYRRSHRLKEEICPHN